VWSPLEIDFGSGSHGELKTRLVIATETENRYQKTQAKQLGIEDHPCVTLVVVFYQHRAKNYGYEIVLAREFWQDELTHIFKINK